MLIKGGAPAFRSYSKTLVDNQTLVDSWGKSRIYLFSFKNIIFCYFCRKNKRKLWKSRFRPANGCCAPATFSPGVDQRLIVNQRLGVTPKRWCTPFYQHVLPSFPSISCLFYLYFVIFAVKTRESFEKVNFDQRTQHPKPDLNLGYKY